MQEAFKVILVSAMPVFELRGGIPLALYLGFSPIESYVLALIGNLLPIPFIILFLNKIEFIIYKIEILNKPYSKIVERVERKKSIVDKYGYFGLTIFVAIPLPVTGAWTGALLAFLLRMNPVKSITFISLGVATAGILVILASLGILNLCFLI